MEPNQFYIVLETLQRMQEAFNRMADAAEAQVKETKAMRAMVERQREERQ